MSSSPSAAATESHAQPDPSQQQYPHQPQQQQQQQYLTEKTAPQQQPFAQYASSYGQPFQPYQSYQAVPEQAGQVPLQQTTQQYMPQPGSPVETKSWKWFKLAAHIAIIVFSIAGFGLGLSVVTNYDLWYFSCVFAPVFGVAAIWSASELITRCSRRDGLGIHPGAHVGLCLVLWLAAVIICGLMTASIAIEPGSADSCDSSDISDPYDDGYTYGYGYDGYDSYDCSWYNHRAELISATVFMYIVFILEFSLFVGACVDTARLNRSRRAPIMVVSGAPFYPMTNQGYHPVSGSYYPPQVVSMYEPYPTAAAQQPSQQPPQPAPQHAAPPSESIQEATSSPSPGVAGSSSRATERRPVAGVPGTSNEHYHPTSPDQNSVKEFYTPNAS